MNIKKAIIPIVIILVSAFATRALVKSRPEVETQEVAPLAPLVRVTEVARQDLRFDVVAQGTVLPRTETTLIAQVAGEVTSVSDNFETGGFFTRGEVLVNLDRRDYEVAVRRAGAQVAQARLALVQQEAEAQVAVEEWGELGEGEPTSLVMRQPQVAQARAGLEAAEAELEKAELDLERTRIRAPFDGRVRAKRVDRGQFLTPGGPVATIHATDYAEIRLPVPDDQLVFLDLPFSYRTSSGASGPEATIHGRFGRERHAWQARIVRTEGELDSRSRMLNLVARVEDPYEPDPENPERPPLAVGMFVEAEIDGRPAEGVFVLPRAALRTSRDVDQMLVVDADERLRFRDVEVVRLDGERVVIGGGLEDGVRVCVSPLDVATDGMRVRTVSAGGGEQ
ncbi:MAG: efflux RND transporter periplasmic adaptor subunit [bacterium]|nr:efflux RND transporter periplasmic adaptor subunit [bacterium]